MRVEIPAVCRIMGDEVNPNRTDRRDRWVGAIVLGGLTLCAAVIRIPFWNLPIRCVETTVFLQFCQGSSHPLIDFLSHYSTPGRHGLHGLAVTLLSQWTGLEFPWVRLPAFVAGVLTVPLTFVVMRPRRGSFSSRDCGHFDGVLTLLRDVQCRCAWIYAGYLPCPHHRVVSG